MSDIDIVLEKLGEVLIKRTEALKSFVRQILVICSSLLGILVAFKEKSISDSMEFYSFISTIVLLGLSILMGLLVLYNEIYNLDKIRESLAKLAEQLNKGNSNASGRILTKASMFLQSCEYVFYVVFGLAICSLVVYSYFAFS